MCYLDARRSRIDICHPPANYPTPSFRFASSSVALSFSLLLHSCRWVCTSTMTSKMQVAPIHIEHAHGRQFRIYNVLMVLLMSAGSMSGVNHRDNSGPAYLPRVFQSRRTACLAQCEPAHRHHERLVSGWWLSRCILYVLPG
jgi:hypothetical protein